MYKLIRPILFNLFKDPEVPHHLAIKSLKISELPGLHELTGSFFKFESKELQTKVFGLDFKNPVGLAGGFDKNGEVVRGLESLGFGFLEIGTVTRAPQPGNPRPRLFRLSQDQALINRMGFNNKGADLLADNLSSKKINIPLGINLGKSKITELKEAVEDYLYSFKKLYEQGDYFVVNISSPNTPGLRQLQEKTFLVEILTALANYRVEQKIQKPILVKVVIDFTLEAISEIVQVCKDLNIDGIITSNTSLSREGLITDPHEAGGLSGKPIKVRSIEIIKHIHALAPELPIIGVGGIFSAEDAYEKIKAGASLIQVYTGLIYEGPGLVKKINKGLVELLKRDGFKNIADAVGIEA